MKKLISSVVVLGTLVASVPSFALVREVASCKTSDGKYEVSIQDNMGTAPVRRSRLSASVRDASGETVGSWLVAETRLGSVSFGREHYQDVATGGQRFDLAGPSTNFRNIRLSMTLPSGETVTDQDLNCSIWNGTVSDVSGDSDVPCSREIESLAVQKAESEGYENCGASAPELSSAIELRMEEGTIGLMCRRHISQISVVTQPVSYRFSARAGDCASATVY